MRQQIRHLYRSMAASLDALLFPPSCILCGTWEEGAQHWLCSNCRFQLLAAPAPSSGTLKSGTTQIQVVTGWSYDEQIARLIHDAKYVGHPSLAVRLGELLAMRIGLQRNLLDKAVAVPVPLHFIRKRTRGFNQSDKIALGLLRVEPQLTIVRCLARIRWTGQQAQLSRERRRVNVQKAFRVKRGKTAEMTAESRILVVDDVITTGSTMLACAEALNSAGFHNIVFVGLARA